MSTHEFVITTTECIHVAHHAFRTVESNEVIAKEILSPASEHVIVAVVFDKSRDGAAVADPVEEFAPKVTPVLGDSPAAAGGFTDEGMEMALFVGASAGIKGDRSEAGSGEGAVEFTGFAAG
jgi:hypothetical protein